MYVVRSFILTRRMETNARFLCLLCREGDEKYQSLSTREDICGVSRKFIFYEIVHNKDFNSIQQHESTIPLQVNILRSPFPHQ
jgi:hypothetical protein